VIANSLFITGCWKTTWTWIEETGGSSTEDRAKEKVVESIHANYHRQVAMPWQSCWIKVQQKRHRRNKGKKA
jgi:hypothetical protein